MPPLLGVMFSAGSFALNLGKNLEGKPEGQGQSEEGGDIS